MTHMRLLTEGHVYIPPKHIKPLCLLGRDDAARTQCSPIVSQLYHPDPFCQLLGRWVRGLPIRWLDDLGVDCRVAIAVVSHVHASRTGRYASPSCRRISLLRSMLRSRSTSMSASSSAGSSGTAAAALVRLLGRARANATPRS